MPPAGFTAGQAAPQGPRPHGGGGAQSFSQLMALVYNQPYDECLYTKAQTMMGRVRRRKPPTTDWPDKFFPDQTQPLPQTKNDILHGTLPHLQPPLSPVTGIAIQRGAVTCDLKSLNDPAKMLTTALAMATAARANKIMRNRGAYVHGDQMERIMLIIAAHVMGIKIKNADQRDVQLAHACLQTNQQIRQQLPSPLNTLDAQAIVQEFFRQMSIPAPAAAGPRGPGPNPGPNPGAGPGPNPGAGPGPNPGAGPGPNPGAAPPPPPPGGGPAGPQAQPQPQPQAQAQAQAQPQPQPQAQPQGGLSNIFNRPLPQDIKNKLQGVNVSEQAYRGFTKAVINAQDARGDRLKEIGKGFKFSSDQIRAATKAMDAEGLTSVSAGKPRVVSYDAAGNPLRVPGEPTIH